MRKGTEWGSSQAEDYVQSCGKALGEAGVGVTRREASEDAGGWREGGRDGDCVHGPGYSQYPPHVLQRQQDSPVIFQGLVLMP